VDPKKIHVQASAKQGSAGISLRRALWGVPTAILLVPALAAAQGAHFLPAGLSLLLQAPLVSDDGGREAGPQPGQESTAQPTPQPDQDSRTPAQPAPPSAVANLQGVVRSATSGEPLPRALVRIEGEADAGTLTDGEGRFEIPGVPVGPQTIQVRKPGFMDRPYATEEVGYEADGPAHSVLVAAGMPDLEFTLTPASAIHGHVELSTGDPAQGITVTLLKQTVHNGRSVWAQDGTTRTNGDGAYRFAGLPEGVYALETQPALESEPAVTVVAAGSAASVARNGFPGVFYPEAREFSAAGRIRLASGDQAEANLSLALEPFYTVTAMAFFPDGRPFSGSGPSEGSSSGSYSVITVLDAAGRRLNYTAQFDQATHTFQANLPDGTYMLLVGAASGEWNTTNQGNTGKSLRMPSIVTGFVEFSVDGHAVANLRIPLSTPPAWQIHVRALRTTAQSGTAASRGLQSQVTVTATGIEASPDGAGNDIIAEDAGPDLLELTSGGLGPVWVSAQVNDRSLCVDSFTAGGVNLAREQLNVAIAAVPPPMELTLRDDCAKLTLQLPQALATFVPGDEPFYTVYVVPDFDTTADVPPMTVHPSSGATLTIDGLTPGNYHVYHFDRPVRLEYRNPAALAALPSPGQAVTLSAGATSNLVLEAPGR